MKSISEITQEYREAHQLLTKLIEQLQLQLANCQDGPVHGEPRRQIMDTAKKITKQLDEFDMISFSLFEAQEKH